MTVELKGLKGLRGLTSILDDNKHSITNNQGYTLLPISSLTSGKYQPRKNFDNTSLIELSNSIKSQGVIQPIIVRKKSNHMYEIIAGERRWKAAQIAGLHEIPAIIRDVSDNTALAFALIENLQREDLNPIDQALGLFRLQNEFSITHEKVAEIVGFSRSTVTNLLRLLTLTDEVKKFMIDGKLLMGHAKLLLALDADLQKILAQEIVTKILSVKETEKLLQKHKEQKNKAHTDIDYVLRQRIKALDEKLSQKIYSQTKISFNQKGEGSITIKVHSIEEAEWLIDNIKLKKSEFSS